MRIRSVSHALQITAFLLLLLVRPCNADEIGHMYGNTFSGTDMMGFGTGGHTLIIFLITIVIIVLAVAILLIFFIHREKGGDDDSTWSGSGTGGPGPSQDGFPEVLLEKYEPMGPVGRGGVSTVFRCRRRSDGRVVAVKIPILSDEKTGKAFFGEMKILEGLSHRNIVRVFSSNILPVPYVEMEYLPDSLERLDFPLKPGIAKDIIMQVLDGLGFAHGKGIIHCDIKPANILLDGDFVPVITDWGLGVRDGDRMTGGYSPGYAAPEQIRPGIFGPPDERCDIYQTGLLLYEMLTGAMPFRSKDPTEADNKVLNYIPPPPSEYSPELGDFDTPVMRCLEKNPSKRFDSIADLKRSLGEDENSPSDTLIR